MLLLKNSAQHVSTLLTGPLPIMKTSCFSLRLNAAPTSLTSELNASKQHFSPTALPIRTNLIPIYKPLLQLKFLNEHYLVYS